MYDLGFEKAADNLPDSDILQQEYEDKWVDDMVARWDERMLEKAWKE